ncbi:MAG: beta-L-arabinofuranosidase domain-containing protein [Anaerolineae bacterium]
MQTRQLQTPTFRPLPLGSIRPSGWLRQQLRIQADGLSGHLDEFWPDVRDSQWFGGDAEAWERAPYWLDGVIPLAYVLDDDAPQAVALKEKVTRYLDYVLTHQHDDGWLGPRTMIAASGHDPQTRYDLWGQILATKVLMQYHDATADGRALAALVRAFRCMDRQIDRAPLFNWGQFRWFEALLALIWLYERMPEPWLLDLAAKLHAQGFDWAAFFNAPAGWPAARPTPRGRWNYMSHVVNNAMAPKGPALWWRFTGDAADRRAPRMMIDKLAEHHGMVTGIFTGDECLAGRRPTQGTELCAVVEYAFSLETLIGILGDPAFSDCLERVVFNALPATFSPDMWAHQYDQQANQVLCTCEDRIWTTNGPESNLFGVEPNYGCCTANLSQGWPKFAAHLWMQVVSEPGIAAVAYAPSRVETEIESVPVTIDLQTDYPFRSDLTFTVNAAEPVTFALWLRIPSWASEPTLRLPDGATVRPQPNSYHRIHREWQGDTTLALTLPMQPKLWHGYRDAVAIERGPLVYALKVGEQWNRVHEDAPYRELPHADWEVVPTTPWAYALDVAEETLTEDVRFEEREIGPFPFSPEGAPVIATVKGRQLGTWGLERGSAADVPRSPVESQAPLTALTLIPYGCTNLRVTEFPTLRRDDKREA